jgi:multisubunit Na+/H+ antiporter MnhC subunit
LMRPIVLIAIVVGVALVAVALYVLVTSAL